MHAWLFPCKTGDFHPIHWLLIPVCHMFWHSSDVWVQAHQRPFLLFKFGCPKNKSLKAPQHGCPHSIFVGGPINSLPFLSPSSSQIHFLYKSHLPPGSQHGFLSDRKCRPRGNLFAGVRIFCHPSKVQHPTHSCGGGVQCLRVSYRTLRISHRPKVPTTGATTRSCQSEYLTQWRIYPFFFFFTRNHYVFPACAAIFVWYHPDSYPPGSWSPQVSWFCTPRVGCTPLVWLVW